MAPPFLRLCIKISEKSNGRLGHPDPPNSTRQGVPFPIELPLPGVRVVSLVAGGMYVKFYLPFSKASHWLFDFKVIPCFRLRWKHSCLGFVLSTSSPSNIIDQCRRHVGWI